MNCINIIKKFYFNNQTVSNIICVISALMLTCILSLNYSVLITYDGYTAESYVVRAKYAFLAVCIATLVYGYLIIKKKVIKDIIDNISLRVFLVSLFFTFSVILQMISDTKRNYTHIKASSLGKVLKLEIVDNYYEVWILVACAVCGISLFFFITYICNVLKKIIFEYFLPFDTYEKRYIIVAFFISVFVIFYFYQRATGQWCSLDLVYQTDTIFLYEHYYPVFSYGFDFDWDIGNGGIRHPLATLVTYPIYIIVFILSNFLFFIPNITAILYAISNAILLILTVIMLVRITNIKWIYIIFSVSYPFTFYLVFLEKYQLSVFLSVLFLYLVKKKADKKLQGTILVASGGVMITSAFCGFAYGSEISIGKRIKEYISIFAAFMLTLILTGRIAYILNFIYLKEQNYKMFYNFDNVTFSEKICKYSNTIVSCFVPVSYEATEKNFFWTDYNTKFNVISLVIGTLILIAFLKHKDKIEIKIFTLWIMWSILQLILASNFPLFNLYYGWAIIPMTLLGIQTLIKNKKLLNCIYVLLSIILLYSNWQHMSDLLDYLVLKTPI